MPLSCLPLITLLRLISSEGWRDPKGLPGQSEFGHNAPLSEVGSFSLDKEKGYIGVMIMKINI